MTINKQKEKFWKAHVSEGLKCTGGISEYCREQNLSKSTFQYWKRRFSNSNSNSNSKPTAKPATVNPFVPVSVTREEKALPDPEWLARFVGEFLRGAL